MKHPIPVQITMHAIKIEREKLQTPSILHVQEMCYTQNSRPYL